MKLLWNNSTSNVMQLIREKMDDIMWKIGLYITYGEVKFRTVVLRLLITIHIIKYYNT
jgi:hypothetical protein